MPYCLTELHRLAINIVSLARLAPDILENLSIQHTGEAYFPNRRRACMRACMHRTVSWMMGGSTRTPCFHSTTSFASDCCTEAVRSNHV